MRIDLLLEVMRHAFAPEPMISLADVERGLRQVLRDDPERAERTIGAMYGRAFKKKEEAYDARERARAGVAFRLVCAACGARVILGPHERHVCSAR